MKYNKIIYKFHQFDPTIQGYRVISKRVKRKKVKSFKISDKSILIEPNEYQDEKGNWLSSRPKYRPNCGGKAILYTVIAIPIIGIIAIGLSGGVGYSIMTP